MTIFGLNLIDLMIIGLPFTPFFTWPVFVVCFLTVRKRPGIRSLVHFRWMSLLIALLTTVYAVFTVARFVNFHFNPEVATFFLVFPVYLLTFMSGVFLWLTYKKKW